MNTWKKIDNDWQVRVVAPVAPYPGEKITVTKRSGEVQTRYVRSATRGTDGAYYCQVSEQKPPTSLPEGHTKKTYAQGGRPVGSRRFVVEKLNRENWTVCVSVESTKEYDADNEEWHRYDHAVLRPLTDQEWAEVQAELVTEADKQDARNALAVLFRNGERKETESLPATAVELLQTADINADKIYDCGDYCLRVVYNGRDGDDWTGNNLHGHSLAVRSTSCDTVRKLCRIIRGEA